MNNMKNKKVEITLCLVVIEPPDGVKMAMQRGKSDLSDLIEPLEATKDALIFAFSLVVADLEVIPVRFTGKFAQGPADTRFVYVRSGTMAGQTTSPWTRRAKVPLFGISAELVRAALASHQPLVAHVAGQARDGGPFCASVPLLKPWHFEEELA